MDIRAFPDTTAMEQTDNDHWHDLQRLHQELEALVLHHGLAVVLEAMLLICRQHSYPERIDRLGAGGR